MRVINNMRALNNCTKTACGCTCFFLLISIVMVILYSTVGGEIFGQLSIYSIYFSFILWVVTISINRETAPRVHPVIYI